MKGYCLKCKKKVEMKDAVKTKTKRNTIMYKGKCPECDTTVCRFGEVKEEEWNGKKRLEENKRECRGN